MLLPRPRYLDGFESVHAGFPIGWLKGGHLILALGTEMSALSNPDLGTEGWVQGSMYML